MTSIYYGLLQDVQTVCAGIITNSYIRRKPFRLESDVALMPLVYITPMLPGGGKKRKDTFNKGVWYDYPVFVVYVQPGAPDMITGLQTFLGNRESLRNALYSFSVATNAFDFAQDPDQTKQFAEFIGSDYDIAGWTFTYSVVETRSGS